MCMEEVCWGTWHPEPGFLRPAALLRLPFCAPVWTALQARPGPAQPTAALGKWPVRSAAPTRLARTDAAVVCFSLSSLSRVQEEVRGGTRLLPGWHCRLLHPGGCRLWGMSVLLLLFMSSDFGSSLRWVFRCPHTLEPQVRGCSSSHPGKLLDLGGGGRLLARDHGAGVWLIWRILQFGRSL